MEKQTGPKILVVDDEPDVEQLIRQKFRRKIREGEMQVVFAGNGVEALEQLKQQPDIAMVLTDINMPEMDGLTLLGQLSRVDPMIKAVVVSAYGDMKNIREAMNRGAFDFVTKPIDFDDLEITLAKTLDHLALLRDALGARDKLVAFQQELSVAAELQRSILPTHFPDSESHEIFACMHPAKNVGGDFYDFMEVAPGKLGLAIADVSGKGMPAALFMAVSRTLLRAEASAGLTPGACLSRVNEMLFDGNDSLMFVTLFYGVLDTTTGEFTYSNGGHCPPYLTDPDGKVRPLPLIGGMALGVEGNQEYQEESISLAPGSSLFLYTDGATEAFDGDGNQFGDERLSTLLHDSADRRPEPLLVTVTDQVREFAAGAEQADDITCLAVRFKAKSDVPAGEAGETATIGRQ